MGQLYLSCLVEFEALVFLEGMIKPGYRNVFAVDQREPESCSLPLVCLKRGEGSRCYSELF